MTFDKWLDTLVDEKGFDTEEVFEVNGVSGINWIPLEVVLAAIKNAPKHERTQIKHMLIRLDFLNKDLLGYFKHLAQALAI